MKRIRIFVSHSEQTCSIKCKNYLKLLTKCIRFNQKLLNSCALNFFRNRITDADGVCSVQQSKTCSATTCRTISSATVRLAKKGLGQARCSIGELEVGAYFVGTCIAMTDLFFIFPLMLPVHYCKKVSATRNIL